MKILLINPSLNQETIGHYNPQVEKTRGCYYSLGLLYIAAALEKEGYSVELFDFDVQEDAQQKLVVMLKDFHPDIVGIHVMTWTFHQANKIAQLAKETVPSVTVIAGGAGVTSLPEAVMKYSVFDYGVISEGEETILELINCIRSKGDPSNISGIIFRERTGISQNKKRPFIPDLDTVAPAAWHLLKFRHYWDVFTRKKVFATMITSRGCPYRCIYCDRLNRMGNLWRSFSNQKILEEIKVLVDCYHINEIMFFDDEFIIDRKKTIELCNMILDAHVKVIWECRARVDVVDRTLLAIMKKAGCYRIRFGFESGDDEILKVLKKDITVKQSLECARLTKESGIEIFGYFMLGSPYETEKTLQKTIRLALEIDPSFALFSKTILIPGSELFDWAAAEGYVAGDYWERFLCQEEHNPALALSTKQLPEETVDNYIRLANKKFYVRPKYILNKALAIRTPYQFLRQVKMAKVFLFRNPFTITYT